MSGVAQVDRQDHVELIGALLAGHEETPQAVRAQKVEQQDGVGQRLLKLTEDVGAYLAPINVELTERAGKQAWRFS